MSVYEYLGLTSQIGVTLLGAVAIFLALVRKDTRFAESDRHFVQAMIQSCIMTTTMSLMPITLALLLDEKSVWTYSLRGALIFGGFIVFVQARSQITMSASEAQRIHIAWHIVAWGIGMVAITFLMYGFFNPHVAPTLYATAVSLIVALGLFVFSGLIFRRFF